MSLTDVLHSATIAPLLSIYGFVFDQIRIEAASLGMSIIIFSILLNLALSPIYFQMETAGRESAARRAAMNEEIARIKKHYLSRERYYYIRTIHRHYRYNPLIAAMSSLDLFLQMLVFYTVYKYLSSLTVFKGVSFAGIPDLSRPDGLLGGLNLLPIAMTLATLASALAYSQDPVRRRNSFLLSALFLLLLYRMPAGIVLYWTSNSVFSFVRNAGERLVNRLLPARGREVVTRFLARE